MEEDLSEPVLKDNETEIVPDDDIETVLDSDTEARQETSELDQDEPETRYTDSDSTINSAPVAPAAPESADSIEAINSSQTKPETELESKPNLFSRIKNLFGANEPSQSTAAPSTAVTPQRDIEDLENEFENELDSEEENIDSIDLNTAEQQKSEEKQNTSIEETQEIESTVNTLPIETNDFAEDGSLPVELPAEVESEPVVVPEETAIEEEAADELEAETETTEQPDLNNQTSETNSSNPESQKSLSFFEKIQEAFKQANQSPTAIENTDTSQETIRSKELDDTDSLETGTALDNTVEEQSDLSPNDLNPDDSIPDSPASDSLTAPNDTDEFSERKTEREANSLDLNLPDDTEIELQPIPNTLTAPSEANSV